MKITSIMCCFIILMNIHGCFLVPGPHITDVNILLPPMMTDVVEYRLQGSDGCFRWSWDGHDILLVVPEYDSSNLCSTSALIRSIATYSGRKETAIYATDEYTGIIIRCKVFIDIFSKIQIFHNSVKLDLEGLTTLHLRAFDAEDNVFSSLAGLRFMWKLIPEDGLSKHLTHIPLNNSPLSDCGGFCGDLRAQIKLEETGLFSDLYVVKGVAVGRELISVHLEEPNMEHIKDQIVVTVAEAMSIDPSSPLFLLIGAVFQLRLKVIHGNILQEVIPPSPFYHWTISNTSVAHMDSEMGTIQAVNPGEAMVTVEDTRIRGHIQELFLYVVVPDNLVLYMLPFYPHLEAMNAITSGVTWHVVSGRHYVVYMKIFAKGQNSKEIYIAENDDVTFHNEADILCKSPVPNLVAVLPKGYHKSCILEPTYYGLGILTASLTYFSALNPERKEHMEVVQEIMVCEQVKITMGYLSSMPPILILPWAPGIHQEVELNATGGCAKTFNDYQWFSSQLDIVSVSRTGIIRVNNPGQVVIRVSSACDLFNYDEVTVDVSFPSSLAMKQDLPSETVVGSYLLVSVTLTAPNGEYYHKCDSFNPFIQWEVIDRYFVINTTENTVIDKPENEELHISSSSPSCAWARLFAFSHGQTVIHSSFSDHNKMHMSFLLTASLPIASFLPLQVLQAGNGNSFGGFALDPDPTGAVVMSKNIVDLSLVPGSRTEVMLSDGPEPREGAKYASTIESFNMSSDDHADYNGVSIACVAGKGLYEVLCRIPGSFKVVFRRGNVMKGDDGCDVPSPIASVELLISCSLPSAIVLLADKPVNTVDAIWMAAQADRDLDRIHVSEIIVTNGRTIRVAAAGVDGLGKAFANSSTIDLSWSLNCCDGLAHWDNNIYSASNWEKFVVLLNESGECIVRATVVGFVKGSFQGIISPSIESSLVRLTDAIRLNIVASLNIEPESKLIFFNPNAKVNLTLTGGSCSLESSVNDSRVVEIVQPPSFSHCLYFILSPKGLGTASVVLHDRGISPPSSASALIRVAEVDWIEISPLKDISIMKGSRFSFDLTAGSNNGGIFDHGQFAFMNISVHLRDDTTDVTINGDLTNSGERYISAPSFIVTARRCGFTSLYVSVKQKHRSDVLSEFVKIEVYPPPRAHPDRIFLAPGASYTMTVEGGPTIGVWVEYCSLDGEIAAVDKISGQITAFFPGNTTLVATFYGNRGDVLSRAFSSIRVGIPSSVELTVQTGLLGVGHLMSVYPSFTEGNLFSFYQVCKGYQWDIEDDKVLGFHGGGLQADFDRSISFDVYKIPPGFVRFVYGRSAGKSNITLSFSCGFFSAGTLLKLKSYRESISIKVIASLPLSLGVPFTWVLPPYYTSSSLLPSSPHRHCPGSRSGNGAVSYTVLGGDHDISIVGERIRTSGSDRLACIQGTDHVTGISEIAACVRVSEVAQIQITNYGVPVHSLHLTVGADLKLPITFHDSLGGTFHEAYNLSAFVAVTNYPDIVSIGAGFFLHNTYAHIKALKRGQALVRVWIPGILQKSEFLLISVGALLVPQNPVLRLGNIINFGYEDGEVLGRWSSSNESILSININTGEARAVGEGSTQVTFIDSSTEIRTMVTVEGQEAVHIFPPQDAAITNAHIPSNGYLFPVVFSNYVDLIKNGTLLHYCKINPPYIGYAKAYRDTGKEKSYCLFFPYSPEHLVRFASTFAETETKVSLVMSVSIRGISNVTASTSALFIAGFSILEMDTVFPWLNFSRDHKRNITVVGNTDVELYWNNPDLMAVRPIHSYGFGMYGKTLFQVEVLTREKMFLDKLSILLPANGQKTEINVKYEPGEVEGELLWADAKSGPLTVAVVCVTVLAAAMMAFIRRMSTPGRSGPSNLSRGGPEGSREYWTPKTPRPFVEYVRRTLDETSVYGRRGGGRRRRFDLRSG